ncbi:MAG: hypothetical protein FJZ94_06025 [Chloroflexi bacterium]|nr:hypothetical protein [Chloroflexota bacterium]MBM4453593.1 hypothetical protein [Chloroflexota bacterium]
MRRSRVRLKVTMRWRSLTITGKEVKTKLRLAKPAVLSGINSSGRCSAAGRSTRLLCPNCIGTATTTRKLAMAIVVTMLGAVTSR